MTASGLNYLARLTKRWADQIRDEKGKAVFQAMHSGADKTEWEELSHRLECARHELYKCSMIMDRLAKKADEQ